jgi:hypothetical protein
VLVVWDDAEMASLSHATLATFDIDSGVTPGNVDPERADIGTE